MPYHRADPRDHYPVIRLISCELAQGTNDSGEFWPSGPYHPSFSLDTTSGDPHCCRSFSCRNRSTYAGNRRRCSTWNISWTLAGPIAGPERAPRVLTFAPHGTNHRHREPEGGSWQDHDRREPGGRAGDRRALDPPGGHGPAGLL